MPKRFPSEFKRDIIAVARRRTVPLEEVAADFDILISSLHRWMRQADVDDGIKDGLTTAEQEELVRLRRDKRTSRWRTRSSGVRPRTSPRTHSLDDLPAGP